MLGELVANDMLLQAWSRSNDWRPDNIWLCRLIPLWEVVVDKDDQNVCLFVLSIVGKNMIIVVQVWEATEGYLNMPESYDV